MTAWSEEEDTELKELVQKHRAKGGKVNWGAVLAAATRTLVVRGKNSLVLRSQRLDPAKRAAKAERRAPKRAAQRVDEAEISETSEVGRDFLSDSEPQTI